MKIANTHWRFLVLIGLFVFVAFLFSVLWLRFLRPMDFPEVQYGVTFSTEYAQQLEMDPFQTYRQLVEELGVKQIRLPMYWSSIERERGEYDWDLMDQLMEYSSQHNLALTLVVGAKVPRWPECYIPDWAEGLDPSTQQRAVLTWIETVVNRYKDSTAVVRWQVENEPFFPFGVCPNMSEAQFQERVDLVRRLDPTRPIQITVSGESFSWFPETDSSDILGFSLYRLTWNDAFGYFLYPLTPEFYYARAHMAKKHVQQVIISELQAEPWFPEPLETRSLDRWYQAFDAQMFQRNIQFVENVHVSEVYLWGAEWWLYLKQHGDPRLWNVALDLF